VTPFDDRHPPAQEVIDACVHCGFCLATCPSYRAIGLETDSPRGRIYLMNALNHGEIPLSEATVSHFDSCLGCLACVTTCPSGVRYDRLIGAMRPQIERNYPRSGPMYWLRQLIFAVFPYPQRLRALLAAVWPYQKLGLQGRLRRWLPAPLAAMESLLPPLSADSFVDRLPEITPAVGPKRFRVGLLAGCVQRVFLPDVNADTVTVLTAAGCEVVVPPQAGCCGALSHHQGQEEQAQALARHTIDAFTAAGVDFVITNASGCGHTLKEYGHLLQEDPQYRDRAQAFAARVRDVQEFLVEVGWTAQLHPIAPNPVAIAYQDACHMLHGQKISLQPRHLLRQIPGVELREPVDAALCCGSAGIYNILQPAVSQELGQQKAQNLTATGAQAIASANVGCILQLRKHLGDEGLPVFHPMTLLAAALQGKSLLP